MTDDEALIQKVATAIDEAEEVWTRYDQESDRFECCRHTDPVLVEPEVLAAFYTGYDAKTEAYRLTLENMDRAAIAAVRAAE
jgi:hypothetical protein